jgi:ferredoxin
MSESEEWGIVVIDDERCQGHGRCYSLEPELFEWSADNDHGRVRVTRVSGDRLARARRIVGECPERAISVVPDETAGDQ